MAKTEKEQDNCTTLCTAASSQLKTFISFTIRYSIHILHFTQGITSVRVPFFTFLKYLLKCSQKLYLLMVKYSSYDLFSILIRCDDIWNIQIEDGGSIIDEGRGNIVQTALDCAATFGHQEKNYICACVEDVCVCVQLTGDIMECSVGLASQLL